MIRPVFGKTPTKGGAPVGVTNLIGINWRETELFPSAGRTDGPIDVFRGDGVPPPVNQPGNYPTTYTNDNLETLVAGVTPPVNPPGNNWSSTWDVRITGTYPVTAAPDMRLDLTVGTWRFWAAWAIYVSQNVNSVFYDGAAGGTQIHTVNVSGVPANDVLNVKGEIKNQTAWAADYDNDYVDLSVTAGYVTIVFSSNDFFSHIRVGKVS